MDSTRVAFTATVLLGAALLFFVEPLFARLLLPRLGGTPAVWSAALVFYQVALLAGYGYAHLLTTRLGRRAQVALHLTLLALVALTLPIGLPAAWSPPSDRNPILWVFGVMTVALGPAFLVVAATGPLIQRWFSHTGHRLAADPYFLYVASNVGSMLGLLAYPFVLEPRLRLAEQSALWSWGYGLLLALTLACAIALLRGAGTAAPAAPRTAAAQPPDARRRLRWLLLAFAPSSLMMAVTTHITTDVAAMPLLWVIPLALYLLSFILVFARRTIVPHVVAVRAMPLLVLPLLIVITGRPAQPIVPIMAFHLLVLLVAALVCHGELARDRPPAEHLTAFYLWMAVGGALGGVFNAVLAPLLFESVVEYPIALVLACALAPPRGTPSTTRTQRILDLALPAVVAALALLPGWLRGRGIPIDRILEVTLVAFLTFPVFSFIRRPLRFALGVAGILLANPSQLAGHSRLLHAQRSFFGVHRVVGDAWGKFHDLWHGTTVHGVQRVEPPGCREPLGYYGREGPLGEVFAAMRTSRPGGRRVAVAGLGAGGIAAYGEPADRWTFFEIDPVVERIASDPKWFCYLSGCAAPVEVRLGDARLSLAAARDTFDLLILDAYSSDAIPVHLLTREALHVYVERLAPNGILAFHISNKFFDLAPVVGALAAEAGLVCRVRDSGPVTDEEMRAGFFPSIYAVAARRPSDLGALAADSVWAPPPVREDLRTWTDDFSSLFSVLRRP